jgi:hypothetical protein
MRTTPASLALLVLFLAISAACGAVPAPAGGATIELGAKDAGGTVHARVGDMVRIKLVDEVPVPGSSLVWRVRSSAPDVLAIKSESGPSPRPAIGNADYTAEFAAQAGGQAVLTAHGAQTCEAMAKPACADQEFTITVVVSS